MKLSPAGRLVASAIWMLASLHVGAGEVRVAVSADFALPLKAIAAEFERHSGHKVLHTAGSTARLSAQIRAGAPFDVFLAADAAAPALLERSGKGVAGSRFPYAVGRLVLWSALPSLVDGNGNILKSKYIDRVAVAAPASTPYGAAAMETLRRLNLLPQIEPKLVRGEDVGRVFGFVASGNAEIGFVAISQVWGVDGIRYGSGWIVPPHLYEPIRQEAVLLAAGRNNLAAAELLAYLQTDAARDLIRAFGYAL